MFKDKNKMIDQEKARCKDGFNKHRRHKDMAKSADSRQRAKRKDSVVNIGG
jgi:hypothetical protein